ncbi:TRI15- transcription factor [Fusarium agapanthi]|uniref:TRI15- transcription factor n=1 Tax=Fusarium agapanthi TaxID=1803897 RepID=A0A9P5EEW1_9HYPO|nr:TRI15- transcription factor [Fusarium agapanthi]
MQLDKPWCSTCYVHFNTFEEHREHSKSDEHVFKIQIRYSGPSIPRYVMEKAMENWDRVKESWNQGSDERPAGVSELCEVETPEFHEELCLFCFHTSSTFDENMAHMKTCHSFTIPAQKDHDIKTITAVRCLHSIVFGCYQCISCGKQRRTLEGIQHHMIAKNHCRFQMTYEISRFCKEEESFDAQETRESQDTQLIRSTQDSHNDRTIIRRPPLRRMPKFLGHESTGGHHMYEEKQRECFVFSK